MFGKNSRQYLDDLHENIAAISAELWGGNARFYERHGHSLNGLPGVWRFAITAAEIFTLQEHKVKPHTFEYLEAILPFAEWLKEIRELPTQSEMEAKAWELIKAASTL